MSDVVDSLRKAKSVFEKQGIIGDPQIAEHIAFLLLERESWDELCSIANNDERAQRFEELRNRRIGGDNSLKDIVPQPPPSRLNLEPLQEIIEDLRSALEACEEDVGELFQYYVRGELLKSSTGGQYPTPRHVVATMAQLIDLNNDTKLIDPACGSGGLLVAAVEDIEDQELEDVEIYGCDFDPTWATLGWSNLKLHEQEPTIQIASALTLLPEQQNEFDYLLMNPPFGGTRSAAEVKASGIDEDFGKRNETVLTALSLQLLKEDGRAATLVSRGVLFGGGAEEKLRTELLKHDLEAVVGLPEDVMQPYNGTGANLILFRKVAQTPESPVWFFQLEKDGYPSGTQRDLTEPPPNPSRNQLPLLADALTTFRTANWEMTLANGNGQSFICGTRLQPENGAGGSIILPSADLDDVTLQMKALRRGVLSIALDENQKTLGWLHLSQDDAACFSGVAHKDRAIDWLTLPCSEGFEDAFSSEWDIVTNKDPKVGSFTYDDGEAIIKKGSSKKLRLKAVEDEAAALHSTVVIIDAEGTSLSPLLTSVDKEGELSELDSGKLESLGLRVLHDAAGESVGGVLTLTTEVPGEGEDEKEVVDAYLVYLTANEIPAYQVRYKVDDHDTIALLTDDGLLLLQLTEDPPRLLVREGEPIKVKSGIQPRGLTLTQSGEIIGVLVRREQIQQEQDGKYVARSFEPREYLIPTISEEPGLATEILADIRRNQSQLNRTIDGLLSMIAAPPRSELSVPPQESLAPILAQHLNQPQRRILQIVEEQTQNGTPVHFRPDDVLSAYREEYGESDTVNRDMIEQNLNLLERMGDVISVVVEKERFYRLASPLEDVIENEPDGDDEV